jgi:hypothetical protein
VFMVLATDGSDKEPRVATYDGQEGWEKMVERR